MKNNLQYRFYKTNHNNHTTTSIHKSLQKVRTFVSGRSRGGQNSKFGNHIFKMLIANIQFMYFCEKDLGEYKMRTLCEQLRTIWVF